MTFRWFWMLLLVGCGGFSRGEPLATADAGTMTDGGTVESASYAEDVHPILEMRCQTCHQNGGTAGSTTFIVSDASTDFEDVKTLVNTSNPENSRLLIKGNGVGHGGGQIIRAGSSEYNVILSWIEGGLTP